MILFISFFFFSFYCHICSKWEVPRLGVKSDLQLQTHASVCGNTRSLTHWARPGIEPVFSQRQVRFLTQWATMGILILCVSLISVIKYPLSFLILVIWVFSFFLSLAKDLSIFFLSFQKLSPTFTDHFLFFQDLFYFCSDLYVLPSPNFRLSSFFF